MLYNNIWLEKAAMRGFQQELESILKESAPLPLMRPGAINPALTSAGARSAAPGGLFAQQVPRPLPKMSLSAPQGPTNTNAALGAQMKADPGFLRAHTNRMHETSHGLMPAYQGA